MSDKPPEHGTVQSNNCVFQDEEGSYTLAIRVMPEQLCKFKAWADHAGVPLDQFMREAADYLCTQNAEDLAIAEHEQAVAEATQSEDDRLVLH